MNPARTAGQLLFIAAAFSVVTWGLFLFTGTPEHASRLKAGLEFAMFLFSSENPTRLEVVGFAALPFCLVGVALGYLSPITRTNRGAICLFVANTVLAVSVAATGPWNLALCAAFPLWWGWKCVSARKPTAPNVIAKRKA